MTEQNYNNAPTSIAENIKLAKSEYDRAFQLVSFRKALAPSVLADEISHMAKIIMEDGTLSPVEKAKLFQEVNDLLVPPPEYNLITLPSGLSALNAYGTFHDPLSAILMQAIEMQPKDVSPYIDRIRAEIKAFPVLDADDRKTVDALNLALEFLEKRDSVYMAEPEASRDIRIYAVTDPDMVAAREALLATRIEHDEDDTAYQAAESIAEEIEALREEAIPYCRNVEMIGLPKDIVTRFSELRARVQDADLDPASKEDSLDLLLFDSLNKYTKTHDSINGVTHSGKILPNGLMLYTSDVKPVPRDDSAEYLIDAYKGITRLEGLVEKRDVYKALKDYLPDAIAHCEEKAGDNKELAACNVVSLQRVMSPYLKRSKRFDNIPLLAEEWKKTRDDVVTRAFDPEYREKIDGIIKDKTSRREFISGLRSSKLPTEEDKQHYKEAIENIDSFIALFRNTAASEYRNPAFIGYSGTVIDGCRVLAEIINNADELSPERKEKLLSEISLPNLVVGEQMKVSDTGIFAHPFMVERNDYRAIQLTTQFVTAAGIAIRDNNEEAMAANFYHLNEVREYVCGNASNGREKEYLSKMLLAAKTEMAPRKV